METGRQGIDLREGAQVGTWSDSEVGHVNGEVGGTDSGSKTTLVSHDFSDPNLNSGR